MWVCFVQPQSPDMPVGSLQSQPATRSRAQVANDAKVMAYMKARVVKLEQELKNAQIDLNTMRARPALATQREKYVLGEMDLVNRQLECECSPCFDYGCLIPFANLTHTLQVLFMTSKQRKLALRSVWNVLLTTHRLGVSIFGVTSIMRAHSPP